MATVGPRKMSRQNAGKMVRRQEWLNQAVDQHTACLLCLHAVLTLVFSLVLLAMKLGAEAVALLGNVVLCDFGPNHSQRSLRWCNNQQRDGSVTHIQRM